MTVQIRRVQDRNTNRVAIERRSSTRERRDGANQSRLAGEFQKFPASPRCVRVKHRLFSMRSHTSSARANISNENAETSQS